MKKAIYLILAFFLGLCFATIVYFCQVKSAFTLSAYPPDFQKLLNTKYGQSEYKIQNGDISMDIERTYSEKYYIKYSWFEFDKSTFSAVFVITNTKKEPLDKNAKVEAILSYNNKDYYTLMTPSIFDYPQDTPLLYKQKLLVSFLPLRGEVKEVNITVKYNSVNWFFNNIPIK